MSAGDLRIASGDPVKRATYRHQRWLADWRKLGGASDAPEARYVRECVRRVRKGTCPDCGLRVSDHALYPDGKCPVVRVPWPSREVVDAFWRGDYRAMIAAPLEEPEA